MLTSIPRLRWPRRSGVAALLTALLVGSLAVAAPAQAHPHYGDDQLDQIFARHCVPPSYIHAHTLDPGSADWLWGYQFLWAQPRFIKSEGRFSTNLTDTAQNVTFSSQVADTVSFTTTHTATTQVAAQLQMNVTLTNTFQLQRSVTMSTTTTIGVNVTATVPPRSTVQADYGVQVYDVGFIFRVFHRDRNNPTRPCRLQGETGTLLMTVPTSDQGWQVSVNPIGAV